MTIRFEPPDDGAWQRPTAHFQLPATPTLRAMYPLLVDRSMARLSAGYGFPFEGMDVAWIEGYPYTRPRLHSDLERLAACEAISEAALADRRWRGDADRWQAELRPALVEANLRLQDVALDGLDDVALEAHLRKVTDHAVDAIALHFELHAADQIPVGAFLVACDRWGIELRRSAAALASASPASLLPDGDLELVAASLREAGAAPTSLDDVRSVSTQAASALDRYLRLHGWRLVTSYDVDGRVEHEVPALTLRALAQRSARRAPGDAGEGVVAAELRQLVPVSARGEFDELLEEARLLYGLRDDHVGLDFLWPVGLIRRALLEVGRRLDDRGRALDPAGAIELAPEEVTDALAGRGPGPDELRRRFERRVEVAAAGAPTSFGPSEDPPFDLLPPGMGMLLRAFERASSAWYADAGRPPLTGDGVGEAVFVGPARVISSPEDAAAQLLPGEVLVVQFTTPSYNAVLASAGALVTQEGGAFSHAAIAARELGIPAVIGAPGVLTSIDTGDIIEVDPSAGRVAVVSR